MLSVSLNNFAEKCAEENCKVSKEKVEHRRTEFPLKREGGLDVESLQSVEAGRAKKGKFGLAKKRGLRTTDFDKVYFPTELK